MSDVIVGAVIAVASASITAWTTSLVNRARWLGERRYEAYLTFFERWEDARALLAAKAPDGEFSDGMKMLATAARPIDLLGDHRGRNAAWEAFQILEKAREGSVTDDVIANQINLSLNAFKRDIGVLPQVRVPNRGA